jgi:2-dehydro-3-deoxy-D-arabinonate dehydratase
MQLCRFILANGDIGIGVVIDDGVVRIDGGVHDWHSLADFLQWTVGRDDIGATLEEIARGQAPVANWPALAEADAAAAERLLAPIDLQEVWAAGVTYRRSREAREEESQGSGIYDRVYDADRPELFLKATPSRVSGPTDPVRIRTDAHWNVPEAELGLVLNQALEIVGYTVGNDMSSRDIEGANPLYLPQAKVYRQCCALGPTIVLADALPQAHNTTISVSIRRNDADIWTDEISTNQIKRSFAELVDYLGRDNVFPSGVVLLTGTGMVPPQEITLQAGDVVTIAIEGIGRLRNSVVQG